MNVLPWDSVIFKMEGVIISTDEFHYAAWKKIGDALHIPFERKEYDQFHTQTDKECLNRFLCSSTVILNDAEKDRLCKRKKELYHHYLDTMSPSCLSSEVKNTMDTLRLNGLKLAIVSESRDTRLILDRIGLKMYFNAVVDSETLKQNETDKDMFLTAAEILDEKAERCIVLSNTLLETKAAKQAGMGTVCIGNTSFSSDTDYCIDHFSELLKIFFG